MAEGTRIRGVHEGKLAEMAEELSLNMEHVSKCFGEVNQRIDGLGIRLDKMDGNFEELKQLLLGIQHSRKEHNTEPLISQASKNASVATSTNMVSTRSERKEGVARPTTELPLEMVANALSRLPIKTTVHCKCVCKRWRSVLSDPYFVDLHLSRSPAGLIVQEGKILKMGEVNDKSDQHDIRHDPLMRLKVPDGSVLSGSVNGLISLRDRYDAGAARICNPVTREYILLPYNKNIEKSIPIIRSFEPYELSGYGLASYGFGYVEASNVYKVVHFYEGKFFSTEISGKSKFEIYSLGTGKWRSLGIVPFLVCHQDGIYANGNLHWLACVQKDRPNEMVCTFDLEKESCQLTASAPQVGGYVDYRSLGMLGGCLCICDNRSDSELVIWVMKDYGVKESWSKEIIIQELNFGLHCRTFYVLKVLKDGSILMLCSANLLFTYHPGTKIWQVVPCFKEYEIQSMYASVYVPSFISLKSFMLENVSGV
ncbi:hypothetical protein ACET3Z_006318 [Daucus carota]